MKRPEYLLSVTAAPTCDVVTIHGDRAGLAVLRDRIDALLARLDREECDHAHLRTSEWAGFELTTSMLDNERASGHSTVHHLELLAWTTAWRATHGL